MVLYWLEGGRSRNPIARLGLYGLVRMYAVTAKRVNMVSREQANKRITARLTEVETNPEATLRN